MTRPLAICALSALLFVACRAPEFAGPTNVLLVSIDTLRPDHLGAYGYRRPTSPHLDGLAARGALFENAVSTAPWTLPAHASMFTSRTPAFHGMQDEASRLADGVPTLASALRSVGHRTLAVVSHVYVSSEFGLDRGFDVFDDSLIQGGATNPVASEAVDLLLEHLGRTPVEPFFAFLHLFDPHVPYTPPAPYFDRFAAPDYAGPVDGTLASVKAFGRGGAVVPRVDLQHIIDLYDGEIAYTDAELGRLFEVLAQRGVLDRTLVIVTSDHGEEFKEHGRIGHGTGLFGEQLRVPLIIAGHPAFAPGSRRQELVSLVDLAPTVLDLVGGSPLEGSVGSSLAGVPSRGARVVFAESVREGRELRMAQSDTHKLIRAVAGDPQFFFELASDPAEQLPLPPEAWDPALVGALDAYAALAESGWHLKFIALDGAPLRVVGRARAEGRIVGAERLSSNLGRYPGPQFARFERFELSNDGAELAFEVIVSRYMGAVRFDTEPVDAVGSFEVDIQRSGARAGLHLADGTELAMGQPIPLERGDPRLAVFPDRYAALPVGVHVRAVNAPLPVGSPSALTPEAVERLRALGYAP